MKILQNTNDNNLTINTELNFKTDAGWQENMTNFEEEILESVINPIENYETMRYIHEPYASTLSINYLLQTDIWFYFYFLDGTNSYTNGIDYSLVGIPPQDNAMMLGDATDSFFRLEFYKTPNDEAPSRTNRKLVFAKNLLLPAGEKMFYNPISHQIFLPVFTGSNYRNKENMYLFWFQDESAFSGTTYTGNTFWMTAKFFNAKDGSIIDFTTYGLSPLDQVNETSDMYYILILDKTNYTYIINRYGGGRVGLTSDPITFYEKR